MSSITYRNGKFRVQIRIEQKYISKTFTRKTDAIKWAKEQEVLIEKGLLESTQIKKLSLSELLRQYESVKLSKLKGYAIEKHRINQIDREIGGYLASEITTPRLAEYRDNQLKNGHRVQTVIHKVGTIKRALKFGMENGFVKEIPKCILPSLKNARNRRLDQKDIERLLKTADEYLKQVVILLIETAMRRGELSSIVLADIDLDSRLVTLRDTKNGDDRTIPISIKALDSLTYLISHAKSDYLLNYSKEWLTEKFIKHCRSIGLEDYRLHDLRHEGVSRLFEKGLNMMEVSSVSGHRDLSMLKRYTHIRPATLLTKLDSTE